LGAGLFTSISFRRRDLVFPAGLDAAVDDRVLRPSRWLLADDKTDSRFTARQGMLLALLVYCGATTLTADFPAEAADKWAWVWKALVFAMFLPLTLRTRLRIEAAVCLWCSARDRSSFRPGSRRCCRAADMAPWHRW
jgi:hypothetical protein